MKRLFYMILFLCMGVMNAHAQQALQQKSFRISRNDIFIKVEKVNKNYYTVGLSRKFVMPVIENVVLTKINEVLDTIWLDTLNIYGRPIGIIAESNDTLAIFNSILYSHLNLNRSSGIGIAKVDTNGTVLQRLEINSSLFRISPSGVFTDEDGHYVVYGTITGSINRPGFQCDWFIMKLHRKTLNVIWERYFNPGESYSCVCYAQPLPNKEYLFSGGNGGKISYLKVDSLGDTIGPIRHLKPINTFGYYNLKVQMHPSGGILYEGISAGTDQTGFLGLTNPDDTTIRWQRTFWGPQLSTRAIITTDGSLFSSTSIQTPYQIFIEKRREDSSIIWRLPLNVNPPGSLFDFNDAHYFEDSSALFVGVIGDPIRQQPMFYLARISNIGRPYNPLSVPGQVVGPREVLVPYPNPVRGATGFQLRGLTQAGELVVYTLTSQEVARLPVQPDQPIQLPNLRPGVYLGRVGGRAFRFLVE